MDREILPCVVRTSTGRTLGKAPAFQRFLELLYLFENVAISQPIRIFMRQENKEEKAKARKGACKPNLDDLLILFWSFLPFERSKTRVFQQLDKALHGMTADSPFQVANFT